MSAEPTASLDRWLPEWAVGPRPVALAGGAVLTVVFLRVLYRVVDVAGGEITTVHLLAVVAGALLLAAVVGRVASSGWALVVAGGLLAVGGVAYLLAVPAGSVAVGKVVGDTGALLTGRSVLRVVAAGVWALALAPAPVFLTWYFLARRAYARGVFVGGLAMGFFALTGDLAPLPALVGAVGGVVTLGFGRLDHEGSLPALRNTVIAVVVAMLVVTTSASLVPGGVAQPLLTGGGGGGTVEASLTGTDASVDVVGSISLSPQVRFSVEASSDRYWRVGGFDRYTGDGWVRTGPTEPYDRYEVELSAPPAESVSPVTQRFTARSAGSTMPAAWRPVVFASDDTDAQVTDLGDLQPVGELEPGDQYRVLSVTPDPDTATLRAAGTDYPAAVAERYTALPERTPARLGRFTDELTADAATPYETARTVQNWLQANKGYSLEVDRPDGDAAAGFVFGMDAGYCTYFATAMVTMLRTQEIPARFVVGYLPGEPVDDGEWVVRGFDSHAWVEVYFPGTGWVAFDPTPAGPRLAAEQARLSEARVAGESNVDTAASQTSNVSIEEWGEGAFGVVQADDPGTLDGNFTANATTPDDEESSGPLAWLPGGLGGDGLPAGETLLYFAILLLGAATAAVRLEVPQRLARGIWLRRLPAGPPAARVKAAVARGEYLLGRRFRPRRPQETWRDYLDALRAGPGGPDPRAEALFRLGERARYAGRATDGDAREAAELLARLRAETG